MADPRNFTVSPAVFTGVPLSCVRGGQRPRKMRKHAAIIFSTASAPPYVCAMPCLKSVGDWPVTRRNMRLKCVMDAKPASKATSEMRA